MQQKLMHGVKAACLLLLFNVGVVYAQAPPPPPPEEPGVPIDGGASILAAAGVAYGVKKYRDFRKKGGEESEPEF